MEEEGSWQKPRNRLMPGTCCSVPEAWVRSRRAVGLKAGAFPAL